MIISIGIVFWLCKKTKQQTTREKALKPQMEPI